MHGPCSPSRPLAWFFLKIASTLVQRYLSVVGLGGHDNNNLTAGAYFWTFPQTSYDTGGLVVGPEWRELDPVKLEFLRQLQPNPTKLK